MEANRRIQEYNQFIGDYWKMVSLTLIKYITNEYIIIIAIKNLIKLLTLRLSYNN